jgi:hypothetical protein
MAQRYTDEELQKMVKSPGWSHSAPLGERADGTLEDVAKLSHAHHQSAGSPGLVRQAETAIELDLIQLEKLWHYLGLPV